MRSVAKTCSYDVGIVGALCPAARFCSIVFVWLVLFLLLMGSLMKFTSTAFGAALDGPVCRSSSIGPTRTLLTSGRYVQDRACSMEQRAVMNLCIELLHEGSMANNSIDALITGAALRR